ncbi:YigZ family protein [Desulfococcaceae bacterium HSG9]|nr:YigZ family protein [Desulfococcaceae bacterium HSG9]
MKPYPIPKANHRVEEKIRRSRFIATAAHISAPEQAKTFITLIKTEFPDATHHCWAYNAGAPGSTNKVGMSDAGEPHGTAGRPMLNVLLHADVGEIVVVATRYFGGVKLGTGGLVRAYSGMVKKVLASLPVEIKTAFVECRISCEYADHNAVKRVLQIFDAQHIREHFDAHVMMHIKLDAAKVEKFRNRLTGFTGGRAGFDVIG